MAAGNPVGEGPNNGKCMCMHAHPSLRHQRLHIYTPLSIYTHSYPHTAKRPRISDLMTTLASEILPRVPPVRLNAAIYTISGQRNNDDEYVHVLRATTPTTA